uniref:PPUP8481 n=1 Tax=Poeciliopsis prolifica TaxID=188132 RepID=A0A0S7EL56_9TELE
MQLKPVHVSPQYLHQNMQLDLEKGAITSIGASTYLGEIIGLSLHDYRLIQHPLHCRCCATQPVDSLLHFSLIHKQDTEILKLLHVGQEVIPDMNKMLDPFLAQDNGVEFGGFDPPASSKIKGQRPPKRIPSTP